MALHPIKIDSVEVVDFRDGDAAVICNDALGYEYSMQFYGPATVATTPLGQAEIVAERLRRRGTVDLALWYCRPVYGTPSWDHSGSEEGMIARELADG